ncbi:type II CAAX prenyl endopeptidase Rce1 family protein [Parasphingorhabdus sp.]|uniref:CPBP family glutamic-type intramembrane protease n=1 Tax=Parasphingorhabdus sp. TaxID=2709688 RepID=UPI00359464D5
MTTTAVDLLAFIRTPRLDHPGSRTLGKATDLAWLFAVNLIIVVAIAAILFPIMLALDVGMSSSMSALFNRPVWQLLLFVVVAGPIVEELMFRLWLSGSPRLLVPFFGLLAWLAGSSGLAQLGWMDSNGLGVKILLAAIVAIVVIGMIIVWKHRVPRWFVRVFPLLFWSQALLFGFVHVFNYAGDNPAALLPFVLPQLVGGLIWGYARICYGWWANIALHMAYNLVAISGLLYMLCTGSDLA